MTGKQKWFQSSSAKGHAATTPSGVRTALQNMVSIKQRKRPRCNEQELRIQGKGHSGFNQAAQKATLQQELDENGCGRHSAVSIKQRKRPRCNEVFNHARVILMICFNQAAQKATLQRNTGYGNTGYGNTFQSSSAKGHAAT